MELFLQLYDELISQRMNSNHEPLNLLEGIVNEFRFTHEPIAAGNEPNTLF